MSRLSDAFRLAALCLSMVAAGFAAAQGPTPPPAPGAPWQEVITGQIEAFRHHDAPAALSFAGASFQESFPDATVFFRVIMGSGYAPIMLSQGHSFGAFEMIGADGVVQVVTLVGPDRQLYRAVYELRREPAGWRVQGVALTGPLGLGV